MANSLEVPDVRDGFPQGNYHKRDLSASAPGISMLVYLDESGDTGWTFSAPYRYGGSSRYLCLAFLFIPGGRRKVTEKIISDLRLKYGWQSEKKASKSNEAQKLEFCAALNRILADYPQITVDCIVCKKENVMAHIRSDANKLYNYMCKLVVIDAVKHLSSFVFIPDKRSLKVESGNSLSDYLQTVLWFECLSTTKTKVINKPTESHTEYNLQVADWIAHCVWSHFENDEQVVFKEISRRIKIRRLFFEPLN